MHVVCDTILEPYTRTGLIPERQKRAYLLIQIDITLTEICMSVLGSIPVSYS